MNAKPKTQNSFHHRMARLVHTDYYPKCHAGGCKLAAMYICEWDQDHKGRPITNRKLYCTDHACNFALKHSIYMADLPDVPLSQLETASRDDWRYSDNHHQDAKTQKLQSSSSSLGDFVVNAQSEES